MPWLTRTEEKTIPKYKEKGMDWETDGPTKEDHGGKGKMEADLLEKFGGVPFRGGNCTSPEHGHGRRQSIHYLNWKTWRP